MSKKSDKRNPGVLEAIKKTGTISRPGSTYTLAEICGVSQPTAWHWLHISIPVNRAIQIETLIGVSRKVIRPDVFGV